MSANHSFPYKTMNMIVSMDALKGIAVNNTVPWYLPNEFEHFYEMTTKTIDPYKINAVVMGRKTWDSIPEEYCPFRNRLNVVISRTMPESISENVIFVNDFEKALKLLNEEEPYKSKVETIWNIGGRNIYALGLDHPWMHKLVMTRIEKTYVTDVKFPEVNWSNFELNNDFDGEPLEEEGVTLLGQLQARDNNPLNGFADAAYTSIATILILLMNRLSINWDKWGEIVLVIISILDAVLLALFSQTNSVYLMYFCYIFYKSCFQVVLTIAQWNIAKKMVTNSYAFVFGVDAFIALILQSMIMRVVADKKGLGMQVREAFIVYAVLHALVALIFSISVVYSFISYYRKKNEMVSREISQRQKKRE
ncbi:hypothetical protein FO519_005145 [Halicephalobus sp. NKZ332]|nr:hypothetical protein FO519_005145 [Halicephalobus sp. NKZ332]